MRLSARIALALVGLAALGLPAVAAGGVRFAEREVSLATAERLPAAEARVLAPVAAPFRFDLVGVRWQGTGTVWLRTRGAAGWSAWRPARPEAEDRPDAGSREGRARAGWTAGNPYWTGPATLLQLRVSGPVTRVLAGYVRSDPWKARRRPAIAETPGIVPRSGWGADEGIVRAQPTYAPRVAFAIVHHTAGRAPSTPEESAAIVRAIEIYHVKSNGWNDIGYNFLVDPFGQIFEGRAGGVDRNVVGAHAEGFNTGSVGIAILGSYDGSGITPEAKDAVERLIAWRLDLAHVDPLSTLTWSSAGNKRFPAGTALTLDAVSGHRDTGFTDCPGTALYAQLPELAEGAAALGLPKLYEPAVSGGTGGPVGFSARLSDALPWTITVTDSTGAAVASASGTGPELSWTWDATAVPKGAYAYRIDAGPAVLPAIGTIGGKVTFGIGGVHADPGAFTPNGDGDADQTALVFTLSQAATATVQLYDSAGNLAFTPVANQSFPAGAASVPWNGAAVDGTPFPDGRYRIVVTAQAGGKTASREGEVVLDRTLGGLALDTGVLSPNGDGRLDALGAGFELTRPASVRVRILAGKRSVALAYAGDLQPGHQAVSWAGRKSRGRVRDGAYTISVEATTDLGTRSLLGSFTVDATAPKVDVTSVSPRAGSTKVRFRLSEAAQLRIKLGRRTYTVDRPAGAGSFWQRARANRIRIVARDAAGNASSTVVAAVRQRS
jgi:flagellar hook assembly protein FlgD